MSSAAEVLEPDTDQIEQESHALVSQARQIVIETDDQYAQAGSFLTRDIKAVRARLNESFDPVIRAANRAHKEALAQKRKLEAPLVEAEGIVKRAIAGYRRRQDEARREAERKAREEARRRAEEEALARAVELEDEGLAEEAEALIEDPPPAAPVPLPPAAPKAEGVSVRKVWRYHVVDVEKIDRKFLIPDDKKIGQIVRSMGCDAARLIGGIECYEEEIVSARAS